MSSPDKREVPAIDGWFVPDRARPRLLGSRCASCHSYAFPREKVRCRNPDCQAEAGAQETVELSARGTLWSYTSAGYKPPPPYVPVKEPFEPFAIAVVELAAEKLCVMGMVPAELSTADLKVGMAMELVVDTLYEDAESRFLTWKWRPAGKENR